MKRLLVATNNKGKLAELRQMLVGLDVELVSLADLGITDEVEETGSTFVENARLKASGYARMANLPAIADDSGLEVDALDRRPGVLSARYGGAETSFDEKMKMLLAEIDVTSDTDRHARFICSIAIANTSGEIAHVATAKCEGKIANGPRGSGGFGYDPIFIPDGYEQTFGELERHVKSKISHRARAFREIMPFLRDFLAKST